MDPVEEKKFQNLRIENEIRRVRLETTQLAIELWKACREAARDTKFFLECQRLVEACAKKEWGAGTEVDFFEDHIIIRNGSKEKKIE